MPFTEQLTERQGLNWANITTINSGSTASVNTGNGINMGIVRRVRAFLHVGTVTGGGSVNFSLVASATSGGSFSAITNLTTNPSITGITTANSFSTIEIRADQMPAGTQWVQALATETGGQNVVVDLIILADESEYKPLSKQSATVTGVGTLTNSLVATT